MDRSAPALGATDSGRGLGRIPALDGLRGVAVLAVVSYHGWNDALPGGIFGVDLFFVLSGFLITSILLKEFRQIGTVSLRNFYRRRALRLMPAATASLVVASVIACVHSRSFHNVTVTSLPSAIVYYSNWQILIHKRELGLINQFWSLSIEEQFYLFWSLVIVASVKIKKRGILLISSVVCMACVVTRELFLAGHHAQGFRLYYGSDTRAIGLFAGSALAVIWPQLVNRDLAIRALRTGVLVAVAGFAFTFMHVADTDGPWLLELFAVVTFCAILIANAVLIPDSPVSLLLSKRPIVALGRISYSVYLWHPLVLFFVQDQPVLIKAPVLFGASLTVGWMSFKWIEQPFLRRKQRASRVALAA